MSTDAKKGLRVTGPSLEVSAAGGSTAVTVPQQLRRRREAAYRCPPLPCGHRDPLDCAATADGPSTYGLTEDELRAHANHLIRLGWTLDEVLTRLSVQPRTTAPIQRLHLEVAA
ncbi:hypothetical protein ACWGHU_12665 [Streptomyces xanthophaeus]